SRSASPGCRAARSSSSARGAAIAYGELAVPDLPLHRAGAVIAGSLDGATLLALGSGDDELRIAATAHAGFRSGALAIDRAAAVASTHGVTLPCDSGGGASVAGAAPRACRRVTGELAARGRLTGALAPALDLVVTGELHGAHVAVDPDPGGAGRIAIGALTAPVTVRIAAGGGSAAPTVAMTGRVAASAVAYDDIAVGAARGSFALGVAGVPGGEVQLERARLDATAIRRAGRLLGDGRVELERRAGAYAIAATARPPIDGLAIATRATARRTAAGYDATLGATTVRLPDGAVWTGEGGALAIPDAAAVAIRLADLTLRRGDASIALSGRFARASGELAAHVGAERLDAASIAEALAAPMAAAVSTPVAASVAAAVSAPAVRGIGRVTVDLTRRGGRWQADADLAVDGLAVAADATQVDAAAHLALSGGRATLTAHVTGSALGELAVALDVAAPGDPFDLAAWRGLDRDAIRTASITARQVALPGLAALIGREGAVPSGSLDGAVDLAPAAAHGQLAVRGIALSIGTLDGDVAIAPHDGELEARASARLVDVATGALTAQLAVPRHPFDPATWSVAPPASASSPATWQRGRALLRAAEAVLDGVAFDPALLARLGLGERAAALPLRGRASARLAIGAAAADARLAIDLDDVTGGPLAAPVSQHVELTAGPTGTHVHAELLGGGAGGASGAASGAAGAGPRPSLGVVDGDVAMTLDRWLDDPAAVLTTRLTAGWTLPATPLAPLLALVGRRELAGGTLEGSATLRGTLGAPVVPSARLVVRDAQIAPRLGGRPVPAIRELAVAASWRGSSGVVRIDAGEAGGGELHTVVTGSPDAPSRMTGTARLVRLDLAPIAALLPGALASLAGEVDGELALRSGGQLTGKLHLARGAVPLAAAIGTLRDATAELTSDAGALTARLDGRLGRGAIHLTAAAAAADLSKATVRVALDGVSPIAALRPVITADVTAHLQRTADQLRGDVTIARGSIKLVERTGTPLLATAVPSDLRLAGSPAPAPAPAGPHPPAHPWLVLHVEPAEIELDARELAEGVGVLGRLHSGPLEVSVGDTVGVTGSVDIASDSVEFLGRRYVVELTPRGPSGVEFDGTIDPRIDLRMSYPFPTMTLSVDVVGRLSKLGRPSFSSDPGGYSQDQLFGYFLGAEPSTDASSQTRDQAREAVTAAGTRVLSGIVGRRINKVLPVKFDALSCEPDPTATVAASGSCTVGKWLSQRLFIAYRQRLQPRADEAERAARRGGARAQVGSAGGCELTHGRHYVITVLPALPPQQICAVDPAIGAA
ncbi:MAG TPA: translocation/assembly module TamB domain-containing protein, partial [Kofleriaceae bacterium]|nr:translocation/assembly module TamB domain-containing protein [Kofleriaceae bacterium]